GVTLFASFSRDGGDLTEFQLPGSERTGEPMRGQRVVGVFGLTAVVLLGIVGTATAKDKWFVLTEQTIKATDPSVRITAEDAKWIKEDVKDVKLSVEGADVEIKKVVLHWNNRPDETEWSVGTLKAGGETAAKSAPGHEGTLGSVTINY